MMKKIDLHTHSTRSDGTLSPAVLARLAKESGLSAVALTDHDTTDGHAEFMAECEKMGIEGIPGVEIGTKYHRELHIVGLYAKGEEFEQMIKRFKNAREERNLKMLEVLNAHGYQITAEDITDEKAGVTLKSSGRVHMANALLKKGYVSYRDEAFEKLIARGKPCYVERFSLTPEDCIAMIKRNDGIAVWAHPVQAVDSEAEMETVARRLKAAGLDGMECLYSRYTDEETAMCKRVAQRVDLRMSGGSDFHGDNKPDVKLGVVNGGFVPYEFLEKLREG